MANQGEQFVSRGGDKLAGALDAFELDVTGYLCADFGCNVGGFTDCLLRRDARQVIAVDTGYGELAWTLRKDPRVIVCERTNALHTPRPQPVDLVCIDVAWTPQHRIVPAAAKWLGPAGRIVSLLKPHFEYEKIHGRKPYKPLSDDESQDVVETVLAQLQRQKTPAPRLVKSPLRGKGGNNEYFLLFEMDGKS